MNSEGKKFGKSEGNALWLDKEKTSPYKIYQYLVNSDDSKVIEYLKVFTFLSKEEIDSLELEVKNRAAQKALAYEVVKDLHGKEEADKAKEISEKIFRGEETEEMPTAEVSSKNILDVMVESKQAPSKSEARRLIIQGGVSINNEKVTDPNFECPQEFILRKGKKSIIKVKIK